MQTAGALLHVVRSTTLHFFIFSFLHYSAPVRGLFSFSGLNHRFIAASLDLYYHHTRRQEKSSGTHLDNRTEIAAHHARQPEKKRRRLSERLRAHAPTPAGQGSRLARIAGQERPMTRPVRLITAIRPQCFHSPEEYSHSAGQPLRLSPHTVHTLADGPAEDEPITSF